MTEQYMPDMTGWSEEDRQLWERARPEDRARSMVSIADLVREDIEDPDTPDHFDVALKSEEDEDAADDDPDAHEHIRMGVATSSVVTKMRQVRDLLRSWGWTVLEMDGWETRGVRALFPSFVGPHHTGATVDIDRMLRDGRSDLNGPLCNFALHLNSDIVLVAAGTANHFGVATIDNDEAYGIECTGPIPISNTGRDAFPMYKAYIALCVAIRIVHGWGVDRIVGHKETARPDGRKPDPAFEEGQPGDGYPSPYPEMARFRSACAVSKVTRAEPEPEDPDDMLSDNAVENKQFIKQCVNEVIEDKFGLVDGTNFALGIRGQTSNNLAFPKLLDTGDPGSIISVVKAIASAQVAQGTALAALADDESNIKAAVTASTAELKAALAELEVDPPADPLLGG
jgi:hypothetical protein